MESFGSRRGMGRAKMVAVAALGVVALISLGTASAATLRGVQSKSVFVRNAAAASGAPTVKACDDFSRAASTAANIQNRPMQLPANCGTGTWASNSGTWTITAGQAGASNTNAATTAVSVGTTDVSAEVTMFNANAASRVGGVAISHTGGTRIFLAGAVTALNTVQIRILNNTTVTTLATATAPIGASTQLRLTRQGSLVTLRVDGTVRATATLTPAQITTLAAGTRAGLYASSSTQLRFNNFVVTTPPSP